MTMTITHPLGINEQGRRKYAKFQLFFPQGLAVMCRHIHKNIIWIYICIYYIDIYILDEIPKNQALSSASHLWFTKHLFLGAAGLTFKLYIIYYWSGNCCVLHEKWVLAAVLLLCSCWGKENIQLPGYKVQSRKVSLLGGGGGGGGWPSPQLH